MERNLTTGGVFKNIVYFSLPYLLSYFLQTLYGMADLFITGQFRGVADITAVAIGSQGMHMLTVMIVGLAMGSTVAIGRAVGGGDRARAACAIGNTVTLFMALSLALTVVLFALADEIVAVMSTPADAVGGTAAYLKICFAGVPFITAYNIISSIFRGLGDTKSPMHFVAAACAVNIALDYLFIGGFGMGPEGAALATTLSQAASVALALFVITRRRSGISVSRGDFRPKRAVMGQILKIGVPITLQDGFIQISFIIITIIVNMRGLADAAAVGIVEKMMSFLFLVPSSMLSAVSALGAQNLGAGKPERIKPVYRDCILTVLLIGVPMCALLYFFGQPLLGIYIAKDDPAYASVIASGMVRVTYMGMTYFVCGIMETCCGMVRGLGRSWMPMVVTIFGACVLRIIWIYTIFQTHHTLDVLYLSYPVSWVVTSAVHVLCFVLIYRRMMARWNAHKEEENASY